MYFDHIFAVSCIYFGFILTVSWLYLSCILAVYVYYIVGCPFEEFLVIKDFKTLPIRMAAIMDGFNHLMINEVDLII